MLINSSIGHPQHTKHHGGAEDGEEVSVTEIHEGIERVFVGGGEEAVGKQARQKVQKGADLPEAVRRQCEPKLNKLKERATKREEKRREEKRREEKRRKVKAITAQ